MPPPCFTPAFRIFAAHADPATTPPDFPAGIELYRQGFVNWAKDIQVDDLWTCAPRTSGDVATLATWAVNHGYRLRPRGMMHTWSPLTVTAADSSSSPLVLLDTTRFVTAMEVTQSATAATPALVKVQTGATMEALLAFLEGQGLGLTATPAPGDITVGGALAIDGHGTAIPAVGEQREPGHGYGSLSNRIVSLTAVTWDDSNQVYRLETIARDDERAAAFLVHLGRAFVTDVTLQVGANDNLRCVSSVDIPGSELFAAPSAAGPRSFASFVEQAGRVEAIWYPFTDNPWLKVWSVEPVKPLTSREVTSPYNYPFSDNVPDQLADLAAQIVTGHEEVTPEFGASMYAVTAAGLPATGSLDIWGKSKNLLLYIKPTTLRVTANGYAIITSRANIQNVVSRFVAQYEALVGEYQAKGEYAASMPIEIRVTGLDQPGEVDGVSPVVAPALSAVRPIADHPDWDVAVWLDLLSFPGTAHRNEFYRRLEEWIFATFDDGITSAVRVEWSKGWAYTDNAAYDNDVILARVRSSFDRWDWAVSQLQAADPNRVFGNTFLDRLLG